MSEQQPRKTYFKKSELGALHTPISYFRYSASLVKDNWTYYIPLILISAFPNALLGWSVSSGPAYYLSDIGKLIGSAALIAAAAAHFALFIVAEIGIYTGIWAHARGKDIQLKQAFFFAVKTFFRFSTAHIIVWLLAHNGMFLFLPRMSVAAYITCMLIAFAISQFVAFWEMALIYENKSSLDSIVRSCQIVRDNFFKYIKIVASFLITIVFPALIAVKLSKWLYAFLFRVSPDSMRGILHFAQLLIVETWFVITTGFFVFLYMELTTSGDADSVTHAHI